MLRCYDATMFVQWSMRAHYVFANISIEKIVSALATSKSGNKINNRKQYALWKLSAVSGSVYIRSCPLVF